MLESNLKSYLHLHLIVFIWGFTAVLGALISIDALPLVWWRMLLAVGFILIWLMFTKKFEYIPKRQILFMLFLGVVIAFHWLTFFKAIKVSNVSVTLACISTGALFTSFLEPIFFKRKIILYEVLFGVLVVVGLYTIFSVETQYVLGILLALTSAFLSALFSVLNGRLAKQYDSTNISFYELLGGVICFTVALFITGDFTENLFILSANDWLYLGILSSICTAYAFIVSVQILKHLSPYTVMLTINLEPIYGIVLAVLIFKDKEKMSPEFYIGAGIILATVVLNGVVKHFKTKKEVLKSDVFNKPLD
jgi:drug/metabolite transporter (DMT)-like permease